ncbi:aminotransferase class V-fold PLP-dependent enzyme [Micromonospora sp. WMMD812]|uniref:aminotransferase class V-fold PLP-dependent enzyme n=1 Tax=Micromonospora sp. WMMD812 TaxID=3015152 RepID=UPI00248CBC66|nr:aminotransferase class V-fold PLP-dependent enzyme [Micromonospora sp. WMMD812]WBB68624.1 aminotransferase class V-fold PLP-dependent enzyme [Micromonospora sp. WMMD812]
MRPDASRRPARPAGAALTADPAYAGTGRIDELRATEYRHLDRDGHVYLDYAGAGVAARAQIVAHHDRLLTGLFSNPHSENPTSEAAGSLVESARRAVLAFFRADPAEYAVVFTPNASGACRLVGEAYAFGRASPLVLTWDNHNSVNGIREYARAAGAPVRYVPLTDPDLRAAEADVVAALTGRDGLTGRGGLTGLAGWTRRWDGAGGRGLFAYPAQSNFSGVQHPLGWVELAQRHGYDVLLDAAAYAPTNRLDLSVVRPQFVCLSWYKLFGYPTGVGALLARRDALARLRRPWFAGGTIRAVSVQGDWHRSMDDESGFEDGTLNFLSIPDVEFGVRWLDSIGVDLVHTRVGLLTGWLLERLTALRHRNGNPLVQVYGPPTADGRGGTVAFNFRRPDGSLVDERLVARESSAAGFSLRTGCFCNPGAGEGAFGITRAALRRTLRHRVETIDEYLTALRLPTGGAVRVSFGLASNAADAERFLTFAASTYLDRDADAGTRLVPRQRC